MDFQISSWMIFFMHFENLWKIKPVGLQLSVASILSNLPCMALL
jgi:hypothetical protein